MDLELELKKASWTGGVMRSRTEIQLLGWLVDWLRSSWLDVFFFSKAAMSLWMDVTFLLAICPGDMDFWKIVARKKTGMFTKSTGWRFQIFFYFHPENWGKISNLIYLFQRGWLKPPTRVARHDGPKKSWKNRGQIDGEVPQEPEEGSKKTEVQNFRGEWTRGICVFFWSKNPYQVGFFGMFVFLLLPYFSAKFIGVCLKPPENPKKWLAGKANQLSDRCISPFEHGDFPAIAIFVFDFRTYHFRFMEVCFWFT